MRKSDTVPLPTEDPLVGKRLREYHILKCIGKGGMAKVYKARHTLLDEIRAVKVLRPELSEMDDFIARFHREAQILVRLRHRHLVMLYDFGTLGKDILFIVMEFLQGESLRRRLRRRGWLLVPEAISIAKQIALGLAVAHEAGVVHRDVSPDNIHLVEENDEHGEEIAKLIDFGVAKNIISVGNAKITGSMEIVGKAEYCSPEQIEPSHYPGENEIDGRSDIYSLGITLYEMLTGVRPFEAKSPQGYLAMHLRKPPKLMSEANPMTHVSPLLEALVMSMLEKDRRYRPASTEELFKELVALHHETAVLTPIS